MPSILGVPYEPRAVLLGILFAALATVGFVALSGYYREGMFALLMGWLVVFVLAARFLLDEPERDGDGGEDPEGGDGG